MQSIEIELWHLFVAVGVLTVLNYVCVFLALGTLRWKDAVNKRNLANVFMEEIGEKIRTEQEFKDIINKSFDERKPESE